MKTKELLILSSLALALCSAIISVFSAYLPPLALPAILLVLSSLLVLLLFSVKSTGKDMNTQDAELRLAEQTERYLETERISRAEIEKLLTRVRETEELVHSLSSTILTDSRILVPLADSIIRAVPEKTEEAAFVVMEKFSVVQDASSKAASEARSLRLELEDASSARSIRYIAERTRSAVLTERSVITDLYTCTNENKEQIKAMGKEIDSGLELLGNITDITERAKLIAFNMSIEAARIGEKGRGFKVIISELHKLNERTFDFSRKIAELLGRFRDYNRIMNMNMQEKASAVIEQVENGMATTEQAVEGLIEASTRAEDFTKKIALISESIDKDLQGVLESMQFQDITRQMLEGSQNILAELHSSIERCLSSCGNTIDRRIVEQRFAEARDKYVKQAKTKGEKEALLEVQL